MKVSFLANSAWYLSNFRSSTLTRFSHSHDITCFFPAKDSGNELKSLGLKTNPFFLDSGSVNPLKECWSLISLFFSILSNRPDVLFSFNPKTNLYGMIICWLLRIPCIPNVSGVGAASELSGILGHIYRSFAGFFYRRAEYVFFQNQSDYETFTKLGWVSPEQSEVIPGSGVDLSIFKPHNRKDKICRFLMAARLINQKGVVEYVNAARQVLNSGYNCHFLLAGVQDYSKRAIDSAFISCLEKEDNIDFIGHIKDMPSLLNDVDCVILPSYYPEGVPRSLIEAASSGKVIITTDTPGCRDLVTEGVNGYLVPPQSVTHLATAIEKLLMLNSDELKNMKQASRDLAVTKYDQEIVIDRYLYITDKVNRKYYFKE